jgi:hypothetical protein
MRYWGLHCRIHLWGELKAHETDNLHQNWHKGQLNCYVYFSFHFVCLNGFRAAAASMPICACMETDYKPFRLSRYEINNNKKFWEELIAHFPLYDKNRLENDASKNSYIIACVFDICGLVVRVPGCRSRGHGFDSRRYQIFWEVVGLERGPLSLVRIIEEILERKVAAPV